MFARRQDRICALCRAHTAAQIRSSSQDVVSDDESNRKAKRKREKEHGKQKRSKRERASPSGSDDDNLPATGPEVGPAPVEDANAAAPEAGPDAGYDSEVEREEATLFRCFLGAWHCALTHQTSLMPIAAVLPSRAWGSKRACCTSGTAGQMPFSRNQLGLCG